ncbi:MAG TPA: glycosyltransferase family 87 protein [Candidatus Binataceae bacterium]|nr:glycosyltransferase family 87 protein [Candidatus Binataceae bacterium]
MGGDPGDRPAHDGPDAVPTVSGRGLAAILDRRWFAILILCIAVLRGVSFCSSLERNFDPQDFSVFYCSGLLLRSGQNPYDADLLPLARRLGLEKGYVLHANNPPTLLLCMVPLTLLSPHRAYWAWQALNAAALAASIFLLFAPRYSGLSGNLALSLAAFAILYPPVGNAFALAQSKILLLLTLAATLRCMRCGRDSIAGLLLAMAGLCWLFPLLLGLYVVLKRRWRMLGYLIAGLAIGGLATVALEGVRTSFSFLTSIDFLTSRTWLSSNSNLSLEAFLSRIFWSIFGEASSPARELARGVFVRGADLAVLYIIVRATPLGAGEDRDWRTLSLWIAASVILSPTAWFHYLLLMLIPFAQMASAANCGSISHRAPWMAAASYLLIGLIGNVLAGVPPHSMAFNALRELEFACLVMAFVAAYWFATDQRVLVESSVG